MDLLQQGHDARAGVFAAGRRLGRYELLVPIGSGGMAAVWAARLCGERGFSKIVAVKTILPHLARDGEFEKMFLDEARIAACLRHPNVCDLYELGEDRGVLYLAMEWVNGDSLFRVLRPAQRSEPLDARLACRIVAEACAGLHAAHELTDDAGASLHVIHRDVSPQNILLSLEGAVKVTDFGVAKAQGQLHRTTEEGQIKGKASYIAPEQIRGEAVDRRSDLFAMGCVLYQATTGERPFRGGDEVEVLKTIAAGRYTAPGRVVAHYPKALARILQRALASDPKDRYETAESMGRALEEWLAGSGAPVMAGDIGRCLRRRLGQALARRNGCIRDAMAARRDPDGTRPVPLPFPARDETLRDPARAAPALHAPPPHADTAREPAANWLSVDVDVDDLGESPIALSSRPRPPMRWSWAVFAVVGAFMALLAVLRARHAPASPPAAEGTVVAVPVTGELSPPRPEAVGVTSPTTAPERPPAAPGASCADVRPKPAPKASVSPKAPPQRTSSAVSDDDIPAYR